MDRIRVAIEVQAGLVPGTAIVEYTRQFFIPSDIWYKEGEWANKWLDAEMEVMKTYGTAQEYMRNLWNPGKVNWVRCDWVYY